ncbi:hypothetical protein ACFQY5_33870 [Paeniroseomonas aquatica]
MNDNPNAEDFETYSVHIHEDAGRLPLRVVQFGSVIVIGLELTPEQRARNSAESEAALRRLREHIGKPGVKIERRPGVPLVYANKNMPGTVIRELNGRKEVGKLLKDGSFVSLLADRPPSIGPGGF